MVLSGQIYKILLIDGNYHSNWAVLGIDTIVPR
jgi:hypothetical protein